MAILCDGLFLAMPGHSSDYDYEKVGHVRKAYGGIKTAVWELRDYRHFHHSIFLFNISLYVIYVSH